MTAPTTEAPRWRLPAIRLRRPSIAAVINAVVVLGLCAFVFWQLHPHLLFRNTTTAGGDMGAHVWQPTYLRDHLLPHGRLTGWTPDWYAGFPALVFYFPLPSLLIVIVGGVVPAAVAFKLITVIGVLTLAPAAFLFARFLGLRDPGPACVAVATLPFLFDRTFTIYGGNIPSTLAGEFAFSISLSLGLVFLGVVARGLETGRFRVLAPVLLALTGLCHVVPAFYAVGGGILLVLMRFDRQRLKWAVPTFLVGGALAGFWVIPFLMRLAYTNDMGWEKITDYRKTLHLASFNWLVFGALVGAVVGIALRRRAAVFLTLMAVGTAIAFAVAPQGRLWNARLLPLWFLWLWLLVGLLAGEVGGFIARAIRMSERSPDGVEPTPRTRNAEPIARAVELATPVVAALAALIMVGMPLRALPFGSVNAATGKYEWFGFESADRSFVPDWVKWNYSGYEDKGKPRHDEYAALVTTMSEIGKTRGCGRAMWEYESEEDGFGTPMALMLLPHWTDGCIGSMEGLFFESSATTPYHFLNQSELSARPSQAQRDLPYSSLNVAQGIDHLKMLGVRYYMAITPEAEKAADADPDLTLIDTSGPWTVNYSSGAAQRTWKIYEVAGSDIVAPLKYDPVVMTNVPKGGRQWLAAAVTWYEDPARWDVPMAASGPKTWKRAAVPVKPLGSAPSTAFPPGFTPGSTSVDTPRVPISDPPVVSGIKTTDNRITFDVSQIGKPVLVKASYFPNWKATGAKGPYRVTPNEMVVIPTSTHVSLYYGNTPVDYLGWFFTLLGLAGLVWLWRQGPVTYPVPPAPAETLSDEDDDEVYSSALERQLAGVSSGADVDRYFDQFDELRGTVL